MKKIFTILMLVTMLALCITGCACEHEWLDANCQAPMTCKLCDATNGEELVATITGRTQPVRHPRPASSAEPWKTKISSATTHGLMLPAKHPSIARFAISQKATP